MKFTDTQLIILSAASQREDRGIEVPPKLKGGAAQRVLGKLIEAKLVEEVRARGGLPVWRRDEANVSYALRITRAGMKAIAAEEERPGEDDAPAIARKASVPRVDARGQPSAPAGKVKKIDEVTALPSAPTTISGRNGGGSTAALRRRRSVATFWNSASPGSCRRLYQAGSPPP